MKPILLAITFLAILVAAVITSVNPAQSATDQFIINYADAVVYLSTSPSAELNSLIANVASRFIVEYSNSIKYYSLTPIPVDLQTLLGQVADRIIIQYANAANFYSLTYPMELIDDVSAPQINNLSATGSGLVQWNTDEYATCEIQYGTLPGIYSYNISIPLFYKLHQIQLVNLTISTTYYYQVSCSDRSGNNAASAEQSFKTSQPIFIPLVRR